MLGEAQRHEANVRTPAESPVPYPSDADPKNDATVTTRSRRIDEDVSSVTTVSVTLPERCAWLSRCCRCCCAASTWNPPGATVASRFPRLVRLLPAVPTASATQDGQHRAATLTGGFIRWPRACASGSRPTSLAPRSDH